MGFLRRLFGRDKPPPAPAKADRPPRPQSRFDAAKTGTENTRHWANADSLSPNAAANAADRKILRERARYEVANNPFAFGAVNTFADDIIGTGPRLQLIGLPEDAARAVESSWQTWADEVGLTDTLRLLVRSGIVDGEGFALAADNPAQTHPVKLDLQPFECDRVTDPTLAVPMTLVDGIEFDRFGNPTRYTVLRQHPGDGTGLFFGPDAFDVYPAAQVYHWFRADRPGQARGVSWLTPALPLFAYLRRYTLATLGAAELAANLAGILKSDLPPGEDTEAPAIETMQEVEIPRGALMTLPPGWDMGQFDAKQPTQTFGDFRTQILVEIARVLGMPLNKITGNSSGYNYSSGRLDHLDYHAGGWRVRNGVRLILLDRLARAWLDEAALVPGVLPDGLPPRDEWAWEWQWDGFGDIDPLKESQAAETLLRLNLTTLAEQCAARGSRWDDVLRQRAREQELMTELGLTPAMPVATATAAPPVERDEAATDTELDEEEVPVDG